MKRIIAFIAISSVMSLGAILSSPAVTHAAQGQPPIAVGPVAITGAPDIGTCNNVWATDSFNKFYKLTLNLDGTYNLQVNYKDGTFVTNAGISPGACESGSNNGNTVSAGVAGKLHEEWNGTVTATATPNQSPDCGPNNASCPSATLFLNAVFGAGHWTVNNWTYTGHYSAGSNGVWFDTSTNWPLNDRGDITGS
jgi:hypothetical protein